MRFTHYKQIQIYHCSAASLLMKLGVYEIWPNFKGLYRDTLVTQQSEQSHRNRGLVSIATGCSNDLSTMVYLISSHNWLLINRTLLATRVLGSALQLAHGWQQRRRATICTIH